MRPGGVHVLLWCIINLYHMTVSAAYPSVLAAAAFPQHQTPTSCDAAAESTQPGCQMELVLATASDSPITATVPTSSKWAWCGIDGRSNIQYTVTAVRSSKAAQSTDSPAVDAYVGVLPGQAAAQRCNALAPSKCRGLYGTTCTTSDCRGKYPGELSGRLKCILVMNSFSKDSIMVTTSVRLQPAGNWNAVIAGVVLATVALVAAMAVGCYTDITRVKAKACVKQQRPQNEPLLQS